MTIAQKKERVLALASAGEQPKNIATELGLHASTVRRVMREGGFASMILSTPERVLVERARKLLNP